MFVKMRRDICLLSSACLYSLPCSWLRKDCLHIGIGRGKVEMRQSNKNSSYFYDTVMICVLTVMKQRCQLLKYHFQHDQEKKRGQCCQPAACKVCARGCVCVCFVEVKRIVSVRVARFRCFSVWGQAYCLCVNCWSIEGSASVRSREGIEIFAMSRLFI